MSSGKRYTPEEKEEIMQYRQTHTYQETTDKYGVSQMTLARWSRVHARLQEQQGWPWGCGERVAGDVIYATALQALKYLEGVKAIALYDDEGRTVSMISENTIYENILPGSTIAMLSVADRSSKMINIGKLEMILIKCSGGMLFMLEAGTKLLLVLLYGGNVDLRKIIAEDLPFIDRVRQDIRNQSEKESRSTKSQIKQ
jgi:predicted regulator of Ras-like GTPase activity (Roadblock/LC7/MglB family)